MNPRVVATGAAGLPALADARAAFTHVDGWRRIMETKRPRVIGPVDLLELRKPLREKPALAVLTAHERRPARRR